MVHSLELEEVNLVNLILSKASKDKYIVFDIGCNRGLFVDLFLNSKQQCEFHCFEPIKSLFENLNLKYSYLNNIKLNNFGISNANTSVIFHELTDLHADGCSSLIERSVFKERGWNYKSYEIEVKTIDSYCFENKIDYIDFMKIDVEGVEPLVFDGMKNLLEKERIEIIQFEYGNTFYDAHFNLDDIYQLTKKYNYSLFHFDQNKFNIINESNFNFFSNLSTNLVFKKND